MRDPRAYYNPPHQPPRDDFLASSTGQASLRLYFIIVGGNIGGLACAYALASAGHNVRILERLKKDDPTSWSGVRIPPNLSKILTEWGLGAEMKEKSVPCYKVMFDDLETGEVKGCIEWKEEVIQETGGDFLLMPHRDLYDMLHRLATGAAAEIIHGAEVVDIIPGAPGQAGEESSLAGESTIYGPPCVVLANGDHLYADIVIGADGNNSLVRNVILSPEDDHGRHSGINLFSTVYSRKQMESDPDLQRLINNRVWDVWMGNKESAVGYPMGNRGEYAFHAYWPDRRVKKDAKEPSWTSQYPTQKLADILSMDNCNSTLQKLIHLPSRIAKTRYIELPNVEQWVHSSGTIAVLGDAGHPSVPCSNQSTGVVIEDAALFGGLFSRIRSWDQVPSLMEAFQDLRKNRSAWMAGQDLMVAQMAQMGPGPERDVRDEGMRQNMNRGLEEWDDSMMQEQWDAIAEVFCYNAMDEAADWWAGWGKLGEMAKQRARDQMDVSIGDAVPNLVQATSVTQYVQYD